MIGTLLLGIVCLVVLCLCLAMLFQPVFDDLERRKLRLREEMGGREAIDEMMRKAKERDRRELERLRARAKRGEI